MSAFLKNALSFWPRYSTTFGMTFLALHNLVSYAGTKSEIGVLVDMEMEQLMSIKVTSASRLAEPIQESPVPISVITAEMLKNSGVRTVNEALITFVPGFTAIADRNEDIVAARGLYATSQQKILVLIDGYRINSHSYLAAPMDYSIALHNIERIEVLRGPGSSLYGNLATGGVVNIILKQPQNLNSPFQIEYTAGNYDQQRTRFLGGTKDSSHSFNAIYWGQLYRTTGEKHALNGIEPFNLGVQGEIRINGVDNQPAHDIGAKLNWHDWSFFFASRRSEWIEPYGSKSLAYQYESLTDIKDFGPGQGINLQSFGLHYHHHINDALEAELSASYDSFNIEAIIATAPAAGLAIQFKDQSFSSTSNLIYRFHHPWGEGSLLTGFQFDTFDLYHSSLDALANGSSTPVTGPPTLLKTGSLLETGQEKTLSAYTQLKQAFGKHWYTNLGVRYDHKERHTLGNELNLSSRLAVVFLPNDDWQFKWAYSEAFVNAPYWYRYSTLPAFGGSESLKPEYNTAKQFIISWCDNKHGLKNAVTLYRQNAHNIITNITSATGTPADPKYINSGSINSQGIENELSFEQKDYRLYWNFQYYKALDGENYFVEDQRFAHVPQFTSSLTGIWLIRANTSLSTTVTHIGKQLYQDSSTNSTKDVPSTTLLNVGVHWEKIASSNVYLDARIYNAMDTTYYQGGESSKRIPYRQAGRWFNLTIGYEF